MNNYLTMELFAEHNGIGIDLASLITKEGRIQYDMNYYIMDYAGRFLTSSDLFETYDHNQALKLSYKDALMVSKQYKCTIEAI